MRSRALITISASAVALALAATAATAFGVGRSSEPSDPGSFALSALGDAFTFQGALDDGGSPANGEYDFRFILYDDGVGGAQVGPTVLSNDIQVSGGIFTASLNFGPVFQGDARWIEVQVRPGSSGGAYTTLSPRQPVSPTPYALYAKNIPLAGNGGASTAAHSDHGHFGASWTGSSTTGLTINQDAAAANGIIVNLNNATDGVGIIAVLDENTGDAIGVEGITNSAAGAGGRFITASSTGTALRASGAGADSNALAIENGGIKVSGANRPAFEFVATAATITGHVTTMDHPMLNDNPNAIVMVTQLWESVYNPHSVGVYYNGGRWRIFNEDGAAMPVNARFFILVINQ